MNDDIVYNLLVYKLIDNIPLMCNYKVISKEKEIYNGKGPLHYTSYKMILLSSKLYRKVYLDLVDYYTEKVIIMSIYDMAKEKAYSFQINMSDYLKDHLKIENWREYMELSKEPNESLENKLQHFFDKLLPVLDNTFYEILEGKTWVDVPSPDWRSFVGM